ncbi:MAG: DUF1206 domain-containing protein, partial [Actinomycetota bacterium]
MEPPTPKLSAAGDRVEDVAEAVGEATTAVASSVAQTLAEQPWVLTVTKAGWWAKAFVYAAIGWAAIVISLDRPGHADAEYTGLVSLLTGTPWARALLVVTALGVLLYVAFRVLSILLIDSNDPDGWAHRIAYSASAATYVTVAWAALDAAIDGRRQDGGSSINEFSAELLVTVPGRILVALGALGALAVAGYFVVKGAARRFLRQIDFGPDVGQRQRLLVEWSGAAGWIGRGLVVVAVAGFLLWAAIEADPDDARGLDRSLQEVAVSSRAGAVAVFAIGALLLVYAGFCALSAPHRSVAWSNRHDPEH